MAIAWTAARASLGTLQDKPLRHIARPAERASTGSLQDKPLERPVRSVSRTRARLLRAVLVPPAFVIQATVATPAQEHAKRVLQASTNLQQAMVIEQSVVRASTELPQDKQLERPVRTVSRTRDRLLRAVLVTPALATQATVATLAQGVATRA